MIFLYGDHAEILAKDIVAFTAQNELFNQTGVHD